MNAVHNNSIVGFSALGKAAERIFEQSWQNGKIAVFTWSGAEDTNMFCYKRQT